MIEFKKVSKFYGDKCALDGIDLTIKKGEIFGIIGRSGAGKSTLLRTINLLESPDLGTILVDGQDLTPLDFKKLSEARHNIGMIFQHFNLLQNKTVRDNIALPMKIQGKTQTQIDKKINELLNLVELENKAHAYPAELSGGQKQRVAIARALSCSPGILLSDEATSALDPETTQAILALLKRINQLYGITIVLITHEMNVIKHLCHRLAVMENGRLQEVTSIAHAFQNTQSLARKMLFSELSPKLPECLLGEIVSHETNKPLLKLYFQGDEAKVPFISQCSRELSLDINILLANIDRYDTITCGILIVELTADETLLKKFIERCEHAGLLVEQLGYVLPAVE